MNNTIPDDLLYLFSDGETTVAIMKTQFFPNQFFAGKVFGPGDLRPLNNNTNQWFKTYEEARASLENLRVTQKEVATQ